MWSFLVGTAVGAWGMNSYIMNKAYNGNIPWLDEKRWKSQWEGCRAWNTDETVNRVREVMRSRGIPVQAGEDRQNPYPNREQGKNAQIAQRKDFVADERRRDKRSGN